MKLFGFPVEVDDTLPENTVWLKNPKTGELTLLGTFRDELTVDDIQRYLCKRRDECYVSMLNYNPGDSVWSIINSRLRLYEELIEGIDKGEMPT